MHPVGDQVADSWEVVGFGNGDDIERPGNRVDSFHHWHGTKRVGDVVGLAYCRFDKNVSTRSQVNSPLTVV